MKISEERSRENEGEMCLRALENMGEKETPGSGRCRYKLLRLLYKLTAIGSAIVPIEDGVSYWIERTIGSKISVHRPE